MAKYSIVHSVRVCTEFVPGTFGRLTAIGPAFMLPTGTQGRRWRRQVCVCTCGTVDVYGTSNLTKGDTRSCGCLQKEVSSRRSTTHGRTKTPEYKSWCKMRGRCDDPKNNQYHNYGARGITYCERWKKFENFLADLGLKPSRAHSLDRRDNDCNYEPSNCRWATPREQANNRRNNSLVEIDGKLDTFSNWCRLFGMPPSTIKRRIRNGWHQAEAFKTPSGPTGPKRKKEKLMPQLPRFIGCLGNIGAGKDMICDYLVAKYHFTKRGFSDPVYGVLAQINPAIPVGSSLIVNNYRPYNDLVHEFGIDYVKRNFPEVRRLLRVIGTECGREVHGPYCWVNYMDRASRGDYHTAIRDVRFASEIDWLRANDTLLIHVTGEREQAPSTHISDNAIDPIEEADYSIVNNGSLADLYRAVDVVVEAWIDR